MAAPTKNKADATEPGEKFLPVFTEETAHEAGFSAHYDRHIRHRVVDFETTRKASVASFQSRLVILCATILLVIGGHYFGYSGLSESNSLLPFTLVASALLLAVGAVFTYAPLAHYRSAVKNQIFPLIIEFFGPFEYQPAPGERVRPLKPFGIVPDYTIEKNEDRFVGNYLGVPIELFETELVLKRKTGRKERSVTVFKGVMVLLDIHKKFSGQTLIRKDAGRITNWFRAATDRLERVRLEDVEFESEFAVYSDDQIEARYLLTTSFMQRLLALRTRYGGKAIECSFYQNKLLMMVPMRLNLFEPGSVFETEDFIDDARSLLRELHSIFQIIDALKLNQKTGL
ncbi:MAG: DUF3137 domain-containing protein [Henriciella sp.]